MTPLTYPYTINISVYNEAGELVKTITNTAASSDPNSMELLMNGTETTAISPGSGNNLSIILPGIQTVQLAKGAVSYATFLWDGTNNAGQDVANGAYYIQETATDPYGHTTSITKPITVINASLYAQLNIFNSAGELVDTIRSDYDGYSWLTLDIKNDSGNGSTYVAGCGKATLTVQYTSSDSITWYGKNAQGNYVESGIYEVQLVAMTAQGLDVVASKTVELLDIGPTDDISGIKAYPNPYTGNTPLVFAWQQNTQGTIRIKIYDMAGELVRTLTGDLSTGKINWDLKSVGGQKVSSGTYICVVEGIDTTGDRITKILKLAAVIGQ